MSISAKDTGGNASVIIDAILLLMTWTIEMMSAEIPVHSMMLPISKPSLNAVLSIVMKPHVKSIVTANEISHDAKLGKDLSFTGLTVSGRIC
jgi:hypothetical protein